MMAAVTWFLVFVLVVGDMKVSCFPSGESEKLKTLSLQGLQGHLATRDSSGGSPGTTGTTTTLSQTSLAADDQFSITHSGNNHIRSLAGCCRECRRIRCVRYPCCIKHCCCDHCNL
ncbi:hypothetical protein UPYG_G00349690 [Umbra pygmaea]|uniref:Uncharacterized protein n=1 Tax=Umbra pygmaea TaxID=75934 RepID=A0ABD0VZ60_UMBPY